MYTENLEARYYGRKTARWDKAERLVWFFRLCWKLLHEPEANNPLKFAIRVQERRNLEAWVAEYTQRIRIAMEEFEPRVDNLLRYLPEHDEHRANYKKAFFCPLTVGHKRPRPEFVEMAFALLSQNIRERRQFWQTFEREYGDYAPKWDAYPGQIPDKEILTDLDKSYMDPNSVREHVIGVVERTKQTAKVVDAGELEAANG